MPQLDCTTFFSQYFWTTLSFFSLLWFTNKYYIPEYARATFFRERILKSQGHESIFISQINKFFLENTLLNTKKKDILNKRAQGLFDLQEFLSGLLTEYCANKPFIFLYLKKKSIMLSNRMIWRYTKKYINLSNIW